MIFNSVTFLLFLTIVVVLWWLLPRTARIWMVFLSSLTFYGFWRVEFIPLMMASVTAGYIAARAIAATEVQSRRKLYLLLSLIVNLGMLFVFKYLIFFTDNANGLLRLLGFHAEMPQFSVVLPLGISFYIFQTISYTVDVYRRFVPAERDFVLFASYVIFFPQLVAGPILRAREVVDQIDHRPTFRSSDIAIGIRRVLYGLFLKVVLADNLAASVDSGFSMNVSGLSALDVWTLAFLFGFQIYFDFSAYSHIALGSARLMGIYFPENFAFPYLATSPRDFWRRWHISLSSWIRDYLYLPLTGAPVHDHSSGGLATAATASSEGRKTRALFATWAIMGLWHGAAWTFLVWGLYHAILVYGYRFSRTFSDRLPVRIAAIGGWIITLPLAMLGWIPFRARSLRDTFGMFSRVVDPRQYARLGLREDVYLVTLLCLLAVIGAYFVQRNLAPRLRRWPGVWIPAEAITLSIATALVFIYLRPLVQFIYFTF